MNFSFRMLSDLFFHLWLEVVLCNRERWNILCDEFKKRSRKFRVDLDFQRAERFDVQDRAELIEDRQTRFFRNRHLLSHILMLLRRLLNNKRCRLADELHVRWRWDWRHVHDGTVRWAEVVCEAASWTRCVHEEVAALILSMIHRWWDRADRADWRCLTIRTSRHAHRFHTVCLLLLLLLLL